MLVMKFGGTSLKNAERMQDVLKIVSNTDSNRIVVLSAMSGITDKLEEIWKSYTINAINETRSTLSNVKCIFKEVVQELIVSPKLYEKCLNEIDRIFEEKKKLIQNKKLRKADMLSIGEYLTSYIFYNFCCQSNINSSFVYAPDYIILNKSGEVNQEHLESVVSVIFPQSYEPIIYITQGFICSDTDGDISILDRGGSDYTATLLGSAVCASEIQIWSDRNGLLNNDPRYVKPTNTIEHISYEEAEEMAYFGAKILHPKCLLPAMEKQIPIIVKNTLNPNCTGTYISTKTDGARIKAIAAKDNITVINLKSGRMYNAYGFLRKIFEVFDCCATPVDMVTTSEVSVSATIDNHIHLDYIVENLQKIGKVTITKNQCIISIVGNVSVEQSGCAGSIFESLRTIPIRMISYGASNKSISLLIDESNRTQALNLLNQSLFNVR